MPDVTITARGEERVRSGHPWIYRSDVGQVHASGGETVHVRSPRGRTLGYALYSDKSEISLRFLPRQDAAPSA